MTVPGTDVLALPPARPPLLVTLQAPAAHAQPGQNQQAVGKAVLQPVVLVREYSTPEQRSYMTDVKATLADVRWRLAQLWRSYGPGDVRVTYGHESVEFARCLERMKQVRSLISGLSMSTEDRREIAEELKGIKELLNDLQGSYYIPLLIRQILQKAEYLHAIDDMEQLMSGSPVDPHRFRW